MVFVFAIGSFSNINASNNQIEEGGKVDCIALAFSVDEDMGGISYDEFNSIVSNCEAQQ